jgi:Fic family protein
LELDPPQLESLDPGLFETQVVLKKLASASRKLAEFKGIAASIPQQDVLINSLGLQEAKDSSAIENIVTTHDELFRDSVFPEEANSAAKEVLRYGRSLRVGWSALQTHGLITTNHILDIQRTLEPAKAGLRRVPGTVLRDQDGAVAYTPPSPECIAQQMADLDRFINDAARFPADPLIKMALIHHQFESIHPFYDGNGRTGRILNVLYLVQQGLLDTPILYMSRHIVRTKPEYYRLLREVRERGTWGAWVTYLLTAVEETAGDGIRTVIAIRAAMLDYKHRIRASHKFYSRDLINHLFGQP